MVISYIRSHPYYCIVYRQTRHRSKALEKKGEKERKKTNGSAKLLADSDIFDANFSQQPHHTKFRERLGARHCIMASSRGGETSLSMQRGWVYLSRTRQWISRQLPLMDLGEKTKNSWMYNEVALKQEGPSCLLRSSFIDPSWKAISSDTVLEEFTEGGGWGLGGSLQGGWGSYIHFSFLHVIIILMFALIISWLQTSCP